MQSKIFALLILLFSYQLVFAQQTVQFAACTTEAEARQKASLVGGYVVQAMVNGKLYYRVQKRFGSVSEARSVAQKANGFVTQDVRPAASKPQVVPPKAPLVVPSRALPQVKRISLLPSLQQSAIDLPFSLEQSDEPLPILKSSAISLPYFENGKYKLVVPVSWKKQAVTYPDCEEGVLFMPSTGGAAIQVFVLGEKIKESPNQILVDYTVDVMSRLAGLTVLATQPVEKDGRLTFDLKLRSQIMGKGMVVRGKQTLLIWAVARPDEFENFSSVIQQAMQTLEGK